MTPQEKATKEIEVFGWMNKKGYDRRASKDVAPIIVRYLEENQLNNLLKPDVRRRSELLIDFIDIHREGHSDDYVETLLDIAKSINSA